MSETDFIVVRDNELYHHGIKGMKWGVRRYQNKDGSLTKLGSKRYNSGDGTLNKRGQKVIEKETSKLKSEKKMLKNKARTQKKIDKVKKLESEVDDLKKATEEADAGESRAAKKERLLNSTNAKEIYENRNLFTTQELNDRINRIDTEARLASKIPEQKTGIDWLNEKMNKASNTINSATNMFQKVDTAYNTVSKSAIGKVMAKKLGIERPKKVFNADKLWANRNNMSNQEFADFTKRLLNESLAQGKMDERAKRNKPDSKSKSDDRLAEAQRQVDEYNRNWYENDRNQNTTYSMRGDHIPDRKTGTGSRSPGSTPKLDEPIDVFSGTVEGKGTSKYRDSGNSFMDNNPVWRDIKTESSTYNEAYKIGSRYISGYLPNKKKK